MAKGSPVRAYVGETQVTCPFCRNDMFVEREIKLNTTGMSLLGMDWANAAAVGLVCTGCGRIEMFMDNGDLRFQKA